MENELKSIKVILDHYDEDAKHSYKEMTIKVNNLKDISDKSHFFNRKRYALTFSMVMPSHIHAFLIGKTIANSKNNTTKSYDQSFAKTINSDTVQGVCDVYYQITQDYKWLKRLENAKLQKVIFFMFETENRDYKSDWDSLEFGQSSQMKFKYAIGYISTKADGSDLRYNHNKELISLNHNRGFYSNHFVAWSQQRQDFFESIHNSFQTIIERINAFQASLSEETINNIIQSQPRLLT